MGPLRVMPKYKSIRRAIYFKSNSTTLISILQFAYSFLVIWFISSHIYHYHLPSCVCHFELGLNSTLEAYKTLLHSHPQNPKAGLPCKTRGPIEIVLKSQIRGLWSCTDSKYTGYSTSSTCMCQTKTSLFIFVRNEKS